MREGYIPLEEWIKIHGIEETEPDKPLERNSGGRILREIYDPEGTKIAIPLDMNTDCPEKGMTQYLINGRQAYFEPYLGDGNPNTLNFEGEDSEIYWKALRTVVKKYHRKVIETPAINVFVWS